MSTDRGSKQRNKVSADSDPTTGAVAVTLSGDTTLDNPSLLYVGGTGDVKVDTFDGDTVTYPNIQAGTFMPILVTKVYSTSNGTTASDIVANW